MYIDKVDGIVTATHIIEQSNQSLLMLSQVHFLMLKTKKMSLNSNLAFMWEYQNSKIFLWKATPQVFMRSFDDKKCKKHSIMDIYY